MSETFTNATADADFQGFGPACLTGAPAGAGPGPGVHPLGGCATARVGPVPPAGGAPHGYLQLTDASTDQAGAVLYNQPVPASQGLEVSFDQWQYGTTTPQFSPADGISFFLVNGAGGLRAPGAFGGSLGYAQKLPDDNPANPFLPGVDNGYLGIGLDVLGNYFGDWEQRGNGCARRSPAGTVFRVPAPGPNMVTVRGPGNGTVGYCFLTATTSNFSTSGPWPSTLPGQLQGPLTSLPPGATPAEAEAALEPSRRRVTVRISPAPDPQVSVDIDFNDGAGSQRVLSFAAPQPVPATYKFGFAASTGQFTDVHLLRNVSVGTAQALPELDLVKQVDVDPPLPPVLRIGTVVPYQYVVTNSGTQTLSGLTVSDSAEQVSCPSTTLGPGQSMVCTANHVVTAADVARGFLRNTAIASGTDPGGDRVTSPEVETTLPIGSQIGLALTKQVAEDRLYRVGDIVDYVYVVTNTSDAVVTGLQLVDDRLGGTSCAATTLQPAGQAGSSTVCRGQYTVTRADAKVGKVTNTAVAVADEGAVVSLPARATIRIKDRHCHHHHCG